MLAITGEPDRMRREKVKRYADLIQRPSEYLEVVDAEIYALHMGKMLAVGVDYGPEAIKFSRSASFWIDAIREDDRKIEIPEVDVSSKDTWALISCSADFDTRADVRNHWVPAFFKEQIPEETFFYHTVEQSQRITAQHRELGARLAELQDQKQAAEACSDLDDDERAELDSAVLECEIALEKLLIFVLKVHVLKRCSLEVWLSNQYCSAFDSLVIPESLEIWTLDDTTKKYWKIMENS